MPEIYLFKIQKADARIEDGRTIVRLFYPANPQPEKRLGQNLPFGVQVFDRLIKEGYSPIADEKNPIKPASSGSVYLLSDGRIICCRRDKGAPTHKLYHSTYTGFTKSQEFVYTAEGLTQTGLRECSEELLLITKDKVPWLIVPNDARDYTLKSARRLGLDMRPRFVDVEPFVPERGLDRLEVYEEDESHPIFAMDTFVDFLYESETSLDVFQIRRLPVSSDEVLPVDAEGMMKDGRFVHFNRESYIIDPSQMGGVMFGAVLRDPTVFQTRIENGVPVVFTPTYQEPYHGPDMVEVVHPHVWAPDNQVCRHLDALGVPGYNWREIELSKEIKVLKGESLLPNSAIKK